MTNRVRLTAGRIRDFGAGAGQAFLWDTQVPGLAVRATAAGAKSFIFQAKLNGQAVRVTIGDVRAWAIDGARQEARRLHTLIDAGRDPRVERAELAAALDAKRAEERRQDVTVGEAWATYVADRSPRWGEHHRHDHAKVAQAGGEPITRGRRQGRTETKPGALAALLPLRLSDLTPERVKSWLTQENPTRPTQTALAFRLLRGFIGWCEEHPDYRGIVNPESCTQKRVRQEVARGNSKAHDTMQREQLQPWFNAVLAIGNPAISAYLQAVLLTGSRREEMLSLKWSDVDFQWKALSIHDKVEGERAIPLTPFVAALLAALPRRNQWVFSSPAAASGRIQEPRIQHEKACRVAGIPRVTIHGLRRTFKNMSEWAELPVGVTAQLMGHKPSAIAERHYTARPLDLLRRWSIKLEAWILEQAGIAQPEEEAVGLRLVKH